MLNFRVYNKLKAQFFVLPLKEIIQDTKIHRFANCNTLHNSNSLLKPTSSSSKKGSNQSHRSFGGWVYLKNQQKYCDLSKNKEFTTKFKL